jgi:hypothetical protein
MQWRDTNVRGALVDSRGEVSQYLHPIVELITIPADVEKSQRGSLMVGWWGEPLVESSW